MIPAIDDVWKKCQEIHSPDNGISFENIRDLYQTASSVKNGVIVEIGSWRGRGTLALAATAAVNGNRVYAVDPWLGTFSDELECVSDFDLFGEWRTNMENAGVGDVVTPLRGAASWVRERWDGGGIDFLFIDGMHNYRDTVIAPRDADIELLMLIGWRIQGAFHPAREARRIESPQYGVKVDYDLWGPLVKPGGYIGFHDVNVWPDVTRVWEEEIVAHPEMWGVVSLEKILGIARRLE